MPATPRRSRRTAVLRTKSLLSTIFLLAFGVLLSGPVQAQNATAPVARQDNASEQAKEGPAVQARSEDKSVPVQIRHENTDRVGRRLVFHMRERFSQSNLFRLTDKEEKKLILYVKTRKEFPGRPGISSVYAATWAFSYGGDVLSNYLRNKAGIAGAESLGALAEELVARTYEVYTRYSYLFQED
jgi:hypothetical protein